MKLKLTIWVIILSLVIAATPIAGAAQVYADDGEQQTNGEQKVLLDLALEYYLTRSPETPICLIIMLKPDPNIDQEIINIRQKYDPQYYDQYCAVNDEIDSFLNQKYGKIQEQAIENIRNLPGTTILYSDLWNNSFCVQTRVDNIRKIASVPNPNIVKINFCGPYLGMPDSSPVKRLYPCNGTVGVGIQPTFSWIPLKDITRYKLVLTSDPLMNQIIVEVQMPTAKYVYDDILEYGTNYWWKVMALEPAPSEWSSIWSFQTEAVPPPPPEVQNQPTSWPLALTLIVVLALAVSAGLVTFYVVRQMKLKK